MAGRKLKDTWESPWNPSGFTPKMTPQTPMLRFGFSEQPKTPVQLPIFGCIDKDSERKVDENSPSKQEAVKHRLSNLFIFDEMEKRRNRKNLLDTCKFGDLDFTNHKKSENIDEECKIDPFTHHQIIRNEHLW